MRKIITLLATVLCSVYSWAQQTTTIEPVRNEKWYGISNTANFGGDKPSMLVSSAGRYIWSASGISARIENDKLTITYTGRKPEPQKGGRTLREAYLTCVHKNMPPSPDNKIPYELFTSPVYYTSGMGLQGQDIVLSQADLLIDSGMPTGTVIIADGWQSVNSFMEFDRELYPDPAAMVRTLHDKGFKVLLTATPYVRAAGRLYHELANSGRLLKDSSGNLLTINTPAGISGCLDVTTYRSRTDEALDRLAKTFGVDGFVFDYEQAAEQIKDNERLLSAFIRDWNTIASRYPTAVYTSLYGAPSDKACILPISSGGAMTWDTMAFSVMSSMSAGLSGRIFTQYSFGVGHNSTDRNMISAASQLGLFMPVGMLPLDCINATANREQLVKNAGLRKSMAAYMEEMLKESAKTAEPLVRHLEYQFPGQGFSNCEDQYMLGSKYMIAPVLDNSSSRAVRLPKGTWTDVNGVRHKGPRVISVDVSNGQIPIFTLQGK